jgi:hypothetical protein
MTGFNFSAESRMYDCVGSLQKEGYTALVIDHWKPRGIDVTHNDYPAASQKGGNDPNLAASFTCTQ